MEKWKVIADYPNYEVSNQGQVRSVTHLAKCRGGGSRSVVGRIRKPNKRKEGGYLNLGLYGGGSLQKFLVHRLVLYAFRGPPPAPGMVCRHLDGDPTNNRLANLVWGTYKENIADKRSHGTQSMGETCGRAKLTEKQVLKIRRLYATGEYSLAAIGTVYGVTNIAVHNIIHRRTWKHI